LTNRGRGFLGGGYKGVCFITFYRLGWLKSLFYKK